MRSEVTVSFNKAPPIRVDLEEVQPLPHDLARVWLDEQFTQMDCEPLRPTGKLLTAEELYEMGVVHILAEPGQGIAAVNKYIHRHSARHAAELCMLAASKRASPIPFAELDDIVGLWVDACMTLGRHDLAVMQRLVSAQSKLEGAAA